MKQDSISPSGKDQTASNRSPGRAALWASLIAAVLLVTAVLPAEYGIDWTGVGRVSGLTPMGERKMAAAKMIGEAQAATLAPATAQVNGAATDQYSTISKLPLRHDDIEVKLAPKGQVEYKTILPEGEFIVFTWDAGGANLKFDFHGELQDQKARSCRFIKARRRNPAAR